MWILKLVGTMMLVCSGFAASYELNRRAVAALRQNEGMMSLLRTVRGQIECFARPISEILSASDTRDLLACGYFGEETPSDLLGLLSQCKVYDRATVKIVLQFAEEFGRGYREDEVRACDYVLSRLEERRVQMAAELPIKKKRNTALAVCASLAIALFLL